MSNLAHRNIPIAIIGGGIHGCAIATRILRDMPSAAKHFVILDRNPVPLLAWRRKTERQGMAFLRSPAVHHIGGDSLGLVDYARTQNRTAELAPPYSQPSTDLFLDFCLHEIETPQLEQQFHQFDVGELRWDKGSGKFPFRIISLKNEGFRAACVILAVGTDDCAYVPPDLNLFKRRFPVFLPHSSEFGLHQVMKTAVPSKIVIVGGGLTAATLAKNLTDLGVEVVLIARKPLKIQQFDFEPIWLGPKALAEFANELDWEERRMMVQKARGEGSVTPEIAEALTKSSLDGKLHLQEGAKIRHIDGESCLQVKTTESTFNHVDLVVLATGYRFDLHRYRFLSNLIEKHKIPTLHGLPKLDKALQLLPVQDLFGSGVIAQLEIGPAAGNIAGVSLAYERMRDKVLTLIPKL
ncbi:MAG: FAD/NAD(P)-binding protein [Candidatus Poribacteria bacterium]|nr:FAD/NAD(P)-binding protein [Candidatus Poribacteria bacterium]MDE0505854.1 FAD/NAD(P)-binding protein [Candidatus Poribacteria bacterium]